MTTHDVKAVLLEVVEDEMLEISNGILWFNRR
jgi:hypothetical protein